MKNSLIPFLLVLAVFSSLSGVGRTQTTEPVFPDLEQTTPIPDEFTDAETGLRILHLSRFSTNYGSVIYFTYNTFSGDSQLTLINSQYKDKWRHLYTFDFDKMTTAPLVTDRLTQNQVVVAKSGNVYFQADNAAWVVRLKGGEPRKLCNLPARWAPGIGFTVNVDETLLVGGSTDTEPSEAAKMTTGEFRYGPNVLFTVNIKTGELKVIHRANAWLGHVQFSPTDPDLLMFCHEGSWEKVDRIWFINPSKSKTNPDGTVTSNAWIAYHRTEPREIVGHEFWRPDGKTIWFQQSYRGRPEPGFYLTSMEIETGKITQYTMDEAYFGIHQTFSPDGSFLISDGTAKKGTRDKGPSKYISRLTIPTGRSTKLKGEHLATLHANDYAVEPNPHVSPDNRWVTFTATLHGTPQAYAVELPRNTASADGQVEKQSKGE